MTAATSISSANYTSSLEASNSSCGGTDSSFADALAVFVQGPTVTAQEAASVAQDQKVLLDTSKGKLATNIEQYFTMQTGVDVDSIPLLMPTIENLAALSRDASEKLRQLFSQLEITPPESISYSYDGQMQLPSDYAHADEFREALEAQPALARELSTINALSSHYAAMQELLPFQQAYEAAESQAEIDQVVERFNYLFSNNRSYAATALEFSATVELWPTINGNPLAVDGNDRKAA